MCCAGEREKLDSKCVEITTLLVVSLPPRDLKYWHQRKTTSSHNLTESRLYTGKFSLVLSKLANDSYSNVTVAII